MNSCSSLPTFLKLSVTFSPARRVKVSGEKAKSRISISTIGVSIRAVLPCPHAATTIASNSATADRRIVAPLLRLPRMMTPACEVQDIGDSPASRVARRGFEPLTSSLKGKRPGPLGDRAAAQGYGPRMDHAVPTGAFRFVHRFISLVDDLVNAGGRVPTRCDAHPRGDIHSLS